MKEKPNRRKRLTILVQYCIQVKETVGWMGKFERVHLPLFGTCQHNLQTVTQLLHQLPHRNFETSLLTTANATVARGGRYERIELTQWQTLAK